MFSGIGLGDFIQSKLAYTSSYLVSLTGVYQMQCVLRVVESRSIVTSVI